ncbi:hypothetical protein HHL22_19440 [Hymenobacter sp. RP-2-7]|uniref:Uncharacterized protein n=1 Tax=Hymenobacter polaris TaxID=2682546 RepID=A0A7Y0AHP8_9BACT|nr:hypothetical protein [Hymenobacter polaris]NML67382.1 hypothetical protein [Hymenobacter polaris]
MDAELVSYLLKEHVHRLSRLDKFGFHIALGDIEPDSNQLQEWSNRMWPKLVAHGWQLDDEAKQYFLAGNREAFREWLAEKLYQEHGGGALLNNCPNCHRLARTFRARQCRYCGHDWH